MSAIKRKTIETVPSPSNWNEIRVNSLIVYRESRDEVVGSEMTESAVVNDAGEKLYLDADGTGRGFFAEGAAPEGWVEQVTSTSVPVTTPARGSIRGVEIVEEDADGNAINRGAEGYASFGVFNTSDLRSLAADNMDTVGAKYEAAIVALQALADAIYVAVK